MKQTALGLTILLAMAPFSAQANMPPPPPPPPPQFTEWGNVSWISAGSSQDTMAVITTAPFVNPGCVITNGGYAADPADPGHDLYHATLMMAFAMNRQVQIGLLGCVYSKPKIISVDIR